ncbi:EamA family transporter [Candidatus Woesearchaeota archaeon]|nr:EamA family transporter [Candidatus Woesearchaeota archaeon]
MLNWIYFVLIAQGIWSITSLIDKIVISKGYIKNPLVYIVLNGLMNVLLIFLLPFVGFEPLKLMDFLIVVISGFLFTASVILYYKAVQYDEISKIAVLFQLAPVFVLTLSFLILGEVLTKNHLIGFLFLLSAGVIVSYKKVENSFKLSKAFYLMLISAICGAISFVAAKHIFNVTSFWSAFLWIRLSGFTALFVLFIPSIRNQFVETFKNMKNKIKLLLSFKMLIDFSAFIFAGYAIINAPVIALISALASSTLPALVFILTLITSLYFPKLIKESIDKKAILTKVLSIALIIIGIVFVNL